MAVVGAGPVGLTVAGYFACRGYKVGVYDKLPEPSGLMVFAISRHRVSLESVVEGRRDLEESFGVKFFTRTKVAMGGFSSIGTIEYRVQTSSRPEKSLPVRPR